MDIEIDILKELTIANKAWIEAKKVAEKEVKEGNSILDAAEKIEAEIRKHADIAFPVNLSRDNSAAHYSPLSYSTEKFGKELVKVDIGAHSNGFTVDGAFTIDLSGKNSKLVKASESALEKAIDYIVKNNKDSKIGKIGEIIENEIVSFGFKPIRNLTGHTIDEFDLHAGKSIPNINTNDPSTLGADKIYAIEPFATTGSGIVKEAGFNSIYFLTGKQTRNPAGREILKEVEERLGLPFSERWVGTKLSPTSKKLALNLLDREGCIKSAHQLDDIPGCLVSQAEKTVYIDEDNKVHVFCK